MALGTSIQAYASKLGLEVKARISEKAHALFEVVRRKLANPDWAADGLLQQLGREAFLENGEWLWMNQTRDVETPAMA